MMINHLKLQQEKNKEQLEQFKQENLSLKTKLVFMRKRSEAREAEIKQKENEQRLMLKPRKPFKPVPCEHYPPQELVAIIKNVYSLEKTMDQLET